MKKYFHSAFHIHTLIICFLTVFFINFYLYLGSIGLSGGMRTALCALIHIGVLAYRYWSWGHDLSVKDRCSLRDFLMGMIPSQIIHVLFYLCVYLVFAFLYRHFLYELFEVLRLGNLALFAFVLGWAFALMGHRIFVLSMESFGCVMALLAVSVAVYISVSYACYAWGVASRERERREMIQGIQRKKRAPFAKRYRFVPLLNIVPLFSFLHRHLSVTEYKMRPAIFLLIFLFVARLLYNALCVWLWSFVPNFYFYYSLKIIGVYLLGIFISSIELRDIKASEKKM